jgi:hypothetical protein
MSYERRDGGRVSGHGSGVGEVWSFKAVQEDLVEARRLWRRAPGGGKWPYAGDGPWHLISEADRALEAELINHARADGRPVTPEPRPLPLTRAEVQWMHQVSEWLLLAPERDRQLIALVLGQLARGAKRVSWKRVRARLSAENSERGLGMRYSRAITAIAQELTRRRVARPWATSDDGDAEALIAALRAVSRRSR